MESTTALDPTGTTKTHNVEILTDEMKKISCRVVPITTRTFGRDVINADYNSVPHCASANSSWQE